MAGFTSVSAAGRSIQRLLQLRFAEEEPIGGASTAVAILRTEDLETNNFAGIVSRPALTLFSTASISTRRCVPRGPGSRCTTVAHISRSTCTSC